MLVPLAGLVPLDHYVHPVRETLQVLRVHLCGTEGRYTVGSTGAISVCCIIEAVQWQYMLVSLQEAGVASSQTSTSFKFSSTWVVQGW
jgi:hypothetical protein